MNNLARHAAWKVALFPVALRAVQRGEFPPQMQDAPVVTDEAQAWGIAHIAASDMLMRRFTRMLPMSEVEAVDPFPATAIPDLPRVTTPVRKLDPAIWGTDNV